MTILRAAALAAIVSSAVVAHADGRDRYHDEAGVWVGIGIFADAVGASLLADLIAPPRPRVMCADPCVPDGYTPYGYTPYGYAPHGYAPYGATAGTRRSSDAAWAGRWW